jgi:hypothetical protein
VFALVNRWFDPCVHLDALDPIVVDWLGTWLAERPITDPLLPNRSWARLGAGLAGSRAEPIVADLVGRGSGLTPSGDDLLAGTLTALRAWVSPSADRLAAAIRSHAPRTTTRLSASLLEAADRAAVIPQAAAVLRTLAGGAEPSGVVRAAEALLGVGHTSGWHLAAGLAVGAAHVLAEAGRSSNEPLPPHLPHAGAGGVGMRRAPARPPGGDGGGWQSAAARGSWLGRHSTGPRLSGGSGVIGVGGMAAARGPSGRAVRHLDSGASAGMAVPGAHRCVGGGRVAV